MSPDRSYLIPQLQKNPGPGKVLINFISVLKLETERKQPELHDQATNLGRVREAQHRQAHALPCGLQHYRLRTQKRKISLFQVFRHQTCCPQPDQLSILKSQGVPGSQQLRLEGQPHRKCQIHPFQPQGKWNTRIQPNVQIHEGKMDQLWQPGTRKLRPYVRFRCVWWCEVLQDIDEL